MRRGATIHHIVNKKARVSNFSQLTSNRVIEAGVSKPIRASPRLSKGLGRNHLELRVGCYNSTYDKSREKFDLPPFKVNTISGF